MFFIIGAILGVPIWIMVSAITGKMKPRDAVAIKLIIDGPRQPDLGIPADLRRANRPRP